ncbi:unnamed protein product [Rotaria sp. Silwood1]|nr:unnamed protein product [Rotaria sp. Silwood1]CAF0969259.1 unnamed protein product [Rotaria sp. Silwood1]CAF3392657.1 unnamed protein product [Rotaria sp. Silwood1]CAF3415151.1 unnamed protein product [Rotaria sp. Silwood1]CAF4641030.1 unnamed protein product [Rotaria sp. Silwood1]
MSSWSLFRIVCLFHAFINVFMGSFMVLSVSTLARLAHGEEVTKKLHLTDEDEKSQLIQTSESLVGMMLIFIAILLYMVSHVEQIEFQRYFSKGCILIHLLLAMWRIFVEARVQTLHKDVKGQILTDLIFAATWVIVLFFTRHQSNTMKNK